MNTALGKFVLFQLLMCFFVKQLILNLEQGSETQINQRAIFLGEKSPRAAVSSKKGSAGRNVAKYAVLGTYFNHI